MRPIDADALTKVIANERDRIQDTYGVNDEYVRCLNKYALSMVESAHTIDAIPVEFLEHRREGLIFAAMTGSQVYGNNTIELCHAINMVLDMWQKEQEAR